MIKIKKLTVNIGVGDSGEELEKAGNLLEKLCKQKPVETISKKTIPGWGVRKKKPIGVKVTLRGQKAEEFLNKVLEAKERTLEEKIFDESGNFAFGIREYIEIPGIKYDPDIGIFGFDVCVTLGKNGYRIKNRKRQKRKVPEKHRLTKEESINWVKEKMNVEIR